MEMMIDEKSKQLIVEYMLRKHKLKYYINYTKKRGR